MVDIKEEFLDKSQASIAKNVQRGFKKAIEKGTMDEAAAKAKTDEIMARLSRTTVTTDGVKNADLVIEAVPENLKLKQDIFAAIDKAAPAHTIFTSNTSSLPIADIGATNARGDKFGGLHFFNPVPLMKLLEVVRGPQTSDATFEALLEYGKVIGKTTVKCKDTPGFIVNRLLVPNMFEAIRLVERGDATKEDVDTAMRLGAGHPMGPFALADMVGLDTCKSIVDGWHKRFPDLEIFKPAKMLDELVAAGKLGAKTGEGFYKYEKK
mmetsp:Transcript_19098/g.46879  ORF Transcript_19098/g.46879 Transcript_19098/m.46879 type:complete len:266 (-) Transcript_19098:105-902(-)